MYEKIKPELIAFLLREINANSIILFGSKAREDDDQFSDIDILIISKKIKNINSYYLEKNIRSQAEIMVPDALLNLAFYSDKEFEDMYFRGSLFIAHVLQEGIVLYDDGFFEQLIKEHFKLSQEELQLSLQLLSNRLAVADNLGMYNRYYIRCLSNFFVITKNLVIITLALQGKTIFNKRQAFSVLADAYPQHRKKLKKLYNLKPFFLRNVKGLDVASPFEPYDCEKLVIELREDIRQLLMEVVKN